MKFVGLRAVQDSPLGVQEGDCVVRSFAGRGDRHRGGDHGVAIEKHRAGIEIAGTIDLEEHVRQVVCVVAGFRALRYHPFIKLMRAIYHNIFNIPRHYA